MKPKNQHVNGGLKEQGAVAAHEVRDEMAAGPSHEEIRERAFQIHCEGGCVHGQDMEDWLQAERELKAKQQVE